jgi:hypothetical protein
MKKRKRENGICREKIRKKKNGKKGKFNGEIKSKC